jgi:hypothetical protein
MAGVQLETQVKQFLVELLRLLLQFLDVEVLDFVTSDPPP